VSSVLAAHPTAKAAMTVTIARREAGIRSNMGLRHFAALPGTGSVDRRAGGMDIIGTLCLAPFGRPAPPVPGAMGP